MAVGSGRIIKNDNNQSILIVEIGQHILAHSEMDLALSYTPEEIAKCDSLITLLANDRKVTFNDGLRDYDSDTEMAMIVRILLNISTPLVTDEHGNYQMVIAGNPTDFDDKIVVHASPRPLSPKTYTHYMGVADNLDTTLHGAGQPLALTITGSYIEYDFKFLSDSQLYMRGAFFGWENAAWGSSLSCEMYAVATQVYTAASGNFLRVDPYHRIHLDVVSGTYSWASNPVPVPAYNANFEPCGYWNVVEDSLVYAVSGTGSYDLYATERQVARFIQKMQIYGDNFQLKSLESDDVEYLPPGYFMRVKIYNPEVHDKLVNGELVTVSGYQIMRLWGTFFSYRQDTLP